MSAVFATPAAVRLPRTVAARRVLLALLFLGGFLALAFLFGGSAHAAEQGGLDGSASGTGDRSSASGPLDPSDAADTARQQAEKHAPAEGGDAAEAADATRDAVPETVRPVQEPVGQQARKVTDPVGDLVRDTADDTLPVDPPGVGLGIGDVDGGAGSGGATPGHGPAEDHATQGDSADHGQKAACDGARMGPGTSASAVTTAPRTAADTGHAPVGPADAGWAQDGGAPAPLPLPRSPLGTASQCTGDSGTPRDGNTDAAVPPSAAAYFGLRPGAVRAESSAPTRERFNEVLEFPG